MRAVLMVIAVGGTALGVLLSGQRLIVEQRHVRLASLESGTAITADVETHRPAWLQPTLGPRDVTPPGVTPAPEVTKPLIRVSAPEAVKVAKAPAPVLFHKPTVLDAGHLRAGKTTIALDGISAPSLQEICENDQGGRWPCGRRAAAALRLLVKSRSLDCQPVAREGDATPDEKEPVFAGRCRMGEIDLAQWLVRNGWAHPSGDAFDADLEAAKTARVGIWSDGRQVRAQ